VIRLERLRRGAGGLLLGNIAARVGALGALALGTLVVARVGGPSAVGLYALLRVVPSLLGVVISCGLPGAVTYFLAGPTRDDRSLALTVVAMALAGGAAGTLLWTLCAPLLRSALFPELSIGLVILAGVTVLTQLSVATVKSCAQGSGDMLGANAVIVNEELMFLPAYGLLALAGERGYTALVVALLAADLITSALAWARVARRGFFAWARRPSLPLARRIASYGWRAQVGGVVTLLNLRLDFILLNIMAGPAVLGIYAIASKFAELLKVPGMALTYVLYPEYARMDRQEAMERARRLIPKAGLAIALACVPLLLTAGFLIPALYGHAFHAAVTPMRIIVVGLALEGVAGVITGYLYGTGRPGLNSWAMGAGLALTVVLDFALIPPLGATGAALASAVAYITSTLALAWFFWQDERSRAVGAWRTTSLSEADVRG
jgi:O-antigen/teichoic acid export membrane protein